MDRETTFRTFCMNNFGGAPDSVHPWEAEGLPPLEIAIWRDCPFEGLLTAVTYGLSTAEHEEWYFAHPELMLRLETSDLAWPMALALLVEAGFGKLPYEHGTVFVLDEPLALDSRMTGFFLYGPPLVEDEEGTCDLGDDELPIQLTGCYPIYESEGPRVEADLEAFWSREDYDMFSVDRPEQSG